VARILARPESSAAQARRAEVMELTIIILIAVEIVLALVRG
jgi:hypothetical protein